ncbi:MAG: shikimate kinase [Acidimicrobiia bacterium]|nr:shikimate kinase [Acidimicrobiia bacterium]
MATLWLVGMMGAGKTRIGPLVAARLGRPFVDLDEVVAGAAGRSVPEIFATEGEAGFRRREAAALVETAGSAAVVACGGGIVVAPENVALLRRTGLVVWLEAPPEVLEERVGDGGGRPLLAGEGRPSLRSLAAAREAAYRGAAHRQVATANRRPEEVADEVVLWWKSCE